MCAAINGHPECVAGESSKPCAVAQYKTETQEKTAGMAVWDAQNPTSALCLYMCSSFDAASIRRWEVIPGDGVQLMFSNGDKTCYDSVRAQEAFR